MYEYARRCMQYIAVYCDACSRPAEANLVTNLELRLALQWVVQNWAPVVWVISGESFYSWLQEWNKKESSMIIEAYYCNGSL